jgi:hypothetical protein
MRALKEACESLADLHELLTAGGSGPFFEADRESYPMGHSAIGFCSCKVGLRYRALKDEIEAKWTQPTVPRET